jgi:hypothetical protein
MLLIIPVLSVTATANSPPEAPEIGGPTNGNVGVNYPYTFCSTDPDEDEITYCIDWGDDTGEACIGPFPSGVCVEASHTFTSGGTFTIRAKASDDQAESGWTELRVTMPRARLLSNTLFTRLLETFPNAFPLLRLLMRLF